MSSDSIGLAVGKDGIEVLYRPADQRVKVRKKTASAIGEGIFNLGRDSRVESSGYEAIFRDGFEGCGFWIGAAADFSYS